MYTDCFFILRLVLPTVINADAVFIELVCLSHIDGSAAFSRLSFDVPYSRL